MPRGNGTGPNGMGAMSGRGAGFCAGYDRPGYMNAGVCGRGMGMGRGRGGGFGRRNQFYATGLPAWARGKGYAPVAAPQDELTDLKQQADFYGGELEQIRTRIRELEAKKDQA